MKKISRRGFLKAAAAITTLPLLGSASEKNTQQKSNTLKFIHITDSHMDLADDDSVAAMKLAVAFINKNYPDLDFVLFGGDNFNNNVAGDKDAVVFKKICDKLTMPYYSVRGNKESSPKGDDEINLAEFQKMFVANRGLKTSGKDWLLETKGYNILGLDSCIEHQNNGKYTQETLAFAEKTLQNKKPTIILNHHPYTNYWGGTEEKDIHKYVLNNTQETQKRLFGYKNLRLTLSGHKHIDSHTKINDVSVVVTRGFIRPKDLDMYPMRYVEITENKISQKLIYTA
ncbi:Serine/threonine protein kinase related protein [hydrothermal vent metagenome]|uniref:Serine/threonine protein kinase related protein n=1 Tax=hydrothermal vent metagenome TaxID=652676 RepID=A0A1W1BZ10_9ZZZZ